MAKLVRVQDENGAWIVLNGPPGAKGEQGDPGPEGTCSIVSLAVPFDTDAAPPPDYVIRGEIDYQTASTSDVAYAQNILLKNVTAIVEVLETAENAAQGPPGPQGPPGGSSLSYIYAAPPLGRTGAEPTLDPGQLSSNTTIPAESTVVYLSRDNASGDSVEGALNIPTGSSLLIK